MTIRSFTTSLLKLTFLSLIFICPSLSHAGPTAQICKNNCTGRYNEQKRTCMAAGSSTQKQQCEANASKSLQACLAECN